MYTKILGIIGSPISVYKARNEQMRFEEQVIASKARILKALNGAPVSN